MSNNTKQTNLKTTKMGAYSAFLTLVVIACVVVVNLLVAELPSTLTKFDTSSMRLYTLSNTTTQIVEGLTEDITMYYIVQKGTEAEAQVDMDEMLARYASYSSHIKIRKIDPTSNPGFSAKYTDDTLTNNSVIVESAKRFSVVTNDDLFPTQYTQEEVYNYYMTGVMPQGTTYFNGEGALTTAIDYVTADDLPVLYIVTGHGEMDLPAVVFDDAKAENILTEQLNLLTVTEIPEDAGAVILNVPTADLNEQERDILLTYLELGGKMILITDFESFSDAAMPILAAVARAYGMQAVSGLIMEGNANNYTQAPYYLLPDINKESDIVMNLSSTNITTVLPTAHGIIAIEGSDKIVEGILSTSADAYIIPDYLARAEEWADTDTPTKAYEKQDGDPTGPFFVAASGEDAVTGGRLLWISSLDYLNENFYVTYHNGSLFMSALTMLCEKSSSISIISKSLQMEPTLTVSFGSMLFWSAIWVIILPIGTIIYGFVVWNRRRKR